MKICLSILHSSSQMQFSVGIHSSKAHLIPPLKSFVIIKNTYNLIQSDFVSRHIPTHQNTHRMYLQATTLLDPSMFCIERLLDLHISMGYFPAICRQFAPK
jgi:hypothetical protein